ncbi:hypothetical protein HNP84_003326 [Thermocatellispora tengchongensis]|uniref:Uncharacterized protein n=1 Tax=Thermocatellispora tengchongensis TaxID=1073253 RepID=A0A840P840_9ACTN|nr:hypothetical protein [Thermocatellispora tengchongensis]
MAESNPTLDMTSRTGHGLGRTSISHDGEPVG